MAVKACVENINYTASQVPQSSIFNDFRLKSINHSRNSLYFDYRLGTLGIQQEKLTGYPAAFSLRLPLSHTSKPPSCVTVDDYIHTYYIHTYFINVTNT